jgi:hypothetical protein
MGKPVLSLFDFPFQVYYFAFGQFPDLISLKKKIILGITIGICSCYRSE